MVTRQSRPPPDHTKSPARGKRAREAYEGAAGADATAGCALNDATMMMRDVAIVGNQPTIAT